MCKIYSLSYIQFALILVTIVNSVSHLCSYNLGCVYLYPILEEGIGPNKYLFECHISICPTLNLDPYQYTLYTI